MVSKMTQGRACAHRHETCLFRGGIFSIKPRQYINSILFFTGIWLLYNVLLVSAAQQSKSAICVVALSARLMGRDSELVSLPGGLPGGAVVKNLLASAGDTRDTSASLGWEDPGEENGNPVCCSCLEKSHGQRSLVGYRLWGCRELEMTE